MPVHGFYPPRAANPETHLLAFSFLPQGAGAPTVATGRGVTTLTRVGVGHYRVTFDQAFKHMLSSLSGVRLAAAADVTVQFGPYDTTNRTIDVFTHQEGTGAVDLAADPDNRVDLLFVFQNSTSPVT